MKKVSMFMSTVTTLLAIVLVESGFKKNVAYAVSSPNPKSNVTVEKYHIFTKIRYRFAQTKVFCQMYNNDVLNAQDVEFELELPEGAFVSNFTMEVNDQRYESFIKQKENAKEIYASFKDLGRSVGIINEEKTAFNLSINLEANATVLFYLEYEEEIIKASNRNGAGHYEYSVSVIPQLTDVKHFCVDVDILEFREFTVRTLNLCNKNRTCIEMDMQKEAVVLQTNANNTRIIWEPTSVPGKKNALLQNGVLGKFKINYEFTSNDSVNEVLIRDGYFVHRFGPRNLPRIPIHVIFVLDISASMCGQRMAQMITAMNKILNDMQPHDYFNIVTFSSSVENWWPYPNDTPEDTKQFSAFPADIIFKTMAKKYVSDLEFYGSTNIYAGLMTALEIAKSSIEKAKDWRLNNKTVLPDSTSFYNTTPMIFFLTDGAPTCGIVNKSLLLKTIRDANRNLSVPIFSLAFGSTADYILVQEISIQNNGIARRIFDEVDADLQLKDFYDFVASPVLKNISFIYTSNLDDNITDTTKSYEAWLPANGEISIAGRIDHHDHFSHDHGVKVSVVSYVILGEGPMNNQYTFHARVCPCGLCSNPSGSSGKYHTDLNFGREDLCGQGNDKDEKDLFMKRFWVNKMIRNMINKVVKGDHSLINNITELALKYNLVTPYTSLLIITPHDNSTDENRRTFNSASNLAQMINRDRNRKGTSLIESTGPKHTNTLVNYSGKSPADTVTKGFPTESQSLRAYLDSLLIEHDMSANTVHTKRAIPTVAKKLGLEDIKWIQKVGNNVTLLSVINSKLGFYNFEIQKEHEKSTEKLTRCNIRKEKIKIGEGQCTHLVNCVQQEFLKDMKLFFHSYFCPLRGTSKNFVGVCCPVSKN